MYSTGRPRIRSGWGRVVWSPQSDIWSGVFACRAATVASGRRESAEQRPSVSAVTGDRGGARPRSTARMARARRARRVQERVRLPDLTPNRTSRSSRARCSAASSGARRPLRDHRRLGGDARPAEGAASIICEGTGGVWVTIFRVARDPAGATSIRGHKPTLRYRSAWMSVHNARSDRRQSFNRGVSRYPRFIIGNHRGAGRPPPRSLASWAAWLFG